MEICDTYDASGNRTGRTVIRGAELPDGEYYLAVHVWIRNEQGDYLIQQRAPHLIYPGVWASTAGMVQAGEDSMTGAIREIAEELGIQTTPAQFKPLMRLCTDNRVEDVWLVDLPNTTTATVTLGPEVTDWRWAAKSTLRQMIQSGSFYAYSYFDQLPD